MEGRGVGGGGGGYFSKIKVRGQKKIGFLIYIHYMLYFIH